jgi:mono/diheme cytochrome c family protein
MPFPFYRSRTLFVDKVNLVVAILLIAGLLCASGASSDPDADVIASGERLVHNMDCNVCHTPKVMTPQGPQPDASRLLSGFPADEKIPPVPEGLIGPTGWGGLFNNCLTAWAGPWGVSFGSNLTPDIKTGIGSWTEEDFVESMRTGMHMEAGRPFLPPMPTYARLTDEELHAIFIYLRSIKPVPNDVPEPLLPPKPDQK